MYSLWGWLGISFHPGIIMASTYGCMLWPRTAWGLIWTGHMFHKPRPWRQTLKFWSQKNAQRADIMFQEQRQPADKLARLLFNLPCCTNTFEYVTLKITLLFTLFHGHFLHCFISRGAKWWEDVDRPMSDHWILWILPKYSFREKNSGVSCEFSNRWLHLHLLSTIHVQFCSYQIDRNTAGKQQGCSWQRKSLVHSIRKGV